MPKPPRHILVCTNSRPPGHPKGSCGTNGAQNVLMQFHQEFQARNLYANAMITGSTCLGPCSMGPIVLVYPEGTWYSKVSPDDVKEIIDSHILDGKPVERLKIPDSFWG